MRSRTCRQVKREEAAVRHNPSSPGNAAASRIFMEKSAEYMAVNIGQSQLLQSEEQELKRRETNTTTPRVKTTWGETRQDQHFGKSTSKIQLLSWTKP